MWISEPIEGWRHWLPLGLLAVLLLACLATDVLRGKIYNKVTYPGIILGLLVHLVAAGPHGFLVSLQGALFGFMGLFIPYALTRGVGGGDVKLMAGVGAFLGLKVSILAFLYSCFVGFVLAMGVVIMKGKFFATMNRVMRFFFTFLIPFMETELPDPKQSERFKFGWAIVGGTIWAVWLVETNRAVIALPW